MILNVLTSIFYILGFKKNMWSLNMLKLVNDILTGWVLSHTNTVKCPSIHYFRHECASEYIEFLCHLYNAHHNCPYSEIILGASVSSFVTPAAHIFFSEVPETFWRSWINNFSITIPNILKVTKIPQRWMIVMCYCIF